MKFILPLSISIFSLLVSSFFAYKQLKYTKNQDKLNILLTEKEEREIEELDKADIRAKLIQDGNKRAVRVSNVGKCTATGVSLTFPDGNSWSIFKILYQSTYLLFKVLI